MRCKSAVNYNRIVEDVAVRCSFWFALAVAKLSVTSRLQTALRPHPLPPNPRSLAPETKESAELSTYYL